MIPSLLVLMNSSVFHGLLAVHSIRAVVKTWQMNADICPTCRQHMHGFGSSGFYKSPSPTEPAFRSGDRKGGDSGVANNEGSFEGDRLIVAGNDEV